MRRVVRGAEREGPKSASILILLTIMIMTTMGPWCVGGVEEEVVIAMVVDVFCAQDVSGDERHVSTVSAVGCRCHCSLLFQARGAPK